MHSDFQPCSVNPLWDDAGGSERAELVAKDGLNRIQKGPLHGTWVPVPDGLAITLSLNRSSST
jgi:hypothetical protein